MAKATLIPQEDNQPYVNLELTKMEARVLRSLLGSVGGSYHTTYRKYTNFIYESLSKVGVESMEWGKTFDATCAKEIE